MKNLYIIGAGGFGREVLWLVERINENKHEWDFQGFIDDNPKIWHSVIDGYEVLGGCEYLCSVGHDIWVVCAIGSSKIRKRVIEKIEACSHIHFAVLIDPSVIKSDKVDIGDGAIICAGTIITVNVKVGKHNIINLDCTIGHDAVLEDFVTLYPSVNVSGLSKIGARTEMGTGAQTIQGIHVGCDTIVGAGAVIIRALPDKCTAVGIPAKPIHFFD